MKKHLLLVSSVVALSAVLGSAHAKQFTIDTSGASTTFDVTGLSVSDVTGLTDTLNSKANINSVYSKTDVDTALAAKANAADTYTKTEVDTALAAKANAADTYTKTETNTAIADAITALDLANTYEAKGAAAAVQTAIETKLGAGASGYDIDAKTLKIGGKAAATEEYVDNATTLTTAATSSAGYAANDSVLTAVTAIDGALKTAEGHIGGMSFTGTNVASGSNLTDAINSLDNAIGDRGYTSTNTITSGSTVSAALSALDAKIGGTLSSTNYIADADTVNANLSALDTQVKTNADNIGDLNYVNNASVNYGAITAGTDLTSAVSQIASNIGAAVTGTNGNVVAGNTVNANLDKIDQNMGNLATLTHGAFGTATTNITTALNTLAANVETATGGTFASDGSWSATVNGTGSVDHAYGTAATNVMAAVNQVASNIGADVSAANGNIATGKSVNENLDALDAVIGDRSAIASLNSAINTAAATNLSAAFETTGNLIGDMDFSGTRFLGSATDLSDALRSLDSNIDRVENKLHTVEHNLKSGLAAMSALSALVPNARDCGNTQISVGTGVYSDRVGVAVGGFHYFNDHVLFNLGASYGGTKDWAFRAGVTFGI